jgi:tetratricopeptide (TPR) repeat protein
MTQVSETRHRRLAILARFYESRQEWEQAEKEYLEAVNLAPEDDVFSLMDLGSFYGRRKIYEKALGVFQKAAAVKEDDLNIQVLIARLHLDFNKIKEAHEAVDKVLAKDQGHVGANLLKGRLHLVEKDFEQAAERLERTAKEAPNNPLAHYYLGWSFAGKGQNAQAKQSLVKAVELDPRLARARLILARIYFGEGKAELARREVEAILQQTPNQLDTLMLQGNLEIQERDVQGAETVFKKVTELYPDYALGHVKLGAVYDLSRRQKESLQSLRKALELDPFETTALRFMVAIHVRNKSYDEALTVCENQKERTKDNPRYQAIVEDLTGRVFLAKGDTAKAREHFEKAIDQDPNILTPYMALAGIYIRGKEIHQAISQYEAILKKNPKFLPGYMALGAIYDQQGEGEKAETYYRKALEINKDFVPAANNLAWNLANRNKNIDEAFSLAKLAREKMPTDPNVMDTLGWIYYLKGINLFALEELQESISRLPNNPLVNYHLGKVYYRNKQYEKAREHMATALKLDPNFKAADDARKLLNR